MSYVMNTKKSLLLSETTETGIDSLIFDIVTMVSEETSRFAYFWMYFLPAFTTTPL